MNNDIKEILEKPNVYSFNDECYLYFGDFNKLRDYITNLQEENINLKTKLRWKEIRIDKATKCINNIFKDENWYENYEYNDLESVLKEVNNILQGENNG